ncbi:AAA family ATPase [Streptomyces sp. NPDC005209]|uniref:AAA family ATPase n=1 Tax=Streptomyces sp. NPDC005209 TaxID=3156715 RepID=UPI0033BDB59E
MTDALADLTRRLAAGESLEDITRSLRPPDWAPVLRACAVARSFDAALYEDLLRHTATGPGPDEPPALTELVDARAVEPVVGAPGTYTLSETDRSTYFLDWISDGADGEAAPAGLLALDRAIGERRRADGDHAEAVRHLLLPEPDEAVALFEEQFAAADARRDFAACQDLVDILGDADRLPFARPAIAELGMDRAGYVRARDHWAADYARSAQFLQPARLAADADRLLTGRRRVWHVHAPGGAGKTMLLRWLVARYCVPAPRDVPCARIDFDVVNPHSVGRHPWLLLLEIAEQFGRRLPGRLFESLAGYGVYRILLDRRPSETAREVASAVDRLDSSAVENELLAAFAERLNPALAGRPAVLVVDTIEELLLHGHPETERLLRMLGSLLQRCRGLRLILAGRHDLRTSIPEALRAFPSRDVKHVQVRPFSPVQARLYLTGMRGITDQCLVQVATDKARGLPFALALLADLIEHDPDITAEQLASCEEPLVRYLIERVVQRIDDPGVRWLLRYGVVPRRLRKEDVRTVMRSWLAKGITDRSEVDDPRLDAHHLRGREDVFPFTAAEPTDDDLERTWQRLLAYASRSSWVSRHAGDDDTVVFHINVLAPMRLLISGHEVFAELHHAFAAHFDALAESDPEQWGAYVKEATYHRFQAGDPDAESRWREAFSASYDGDDPELMRELCEELLGDEYLEGGRPRPRADGQPLIGRRAVVLAHLGAAMAVLRGRTNDSSGVAPLFLLTLANSSDPAWSEIEHHLSRVERLVAESDEPIDLRGADTLLRALVLVGRQQHEEASELIRTLLESELPAPIQEGLQMILATIQTQLNDPEAETTFRNAMSRARASGRVADEAAISRQLAHVLEDRGRVDAAIEVHREVAAAETLAGAHAATKNRALLSLARVELQTYAPHSALGTLRDIDLTALPPTDQVEALQFEAQAHQFLFRSKLALDALDRADRVALADIGDATRYRCLAWTALQRGVFEGQLLSVDEAERSFDRAAALWSDLGYPEGHPQSLLLYAQYLVQEMGDLRRAAQTLELVRAVDTSGELAVRTALLWHTLAERGFEVPDASLLTVPRGSQKDLLEGGVAAVLADPGRAPELADALAAVEAPTARVAALLGLSLCRTPERQPRPELDLLRPLFEPLLHTEGPDLDHYVRLTRLAEFERVSGRPEEAARLVARAYPALCEAAGDDPLPRWRWARAQIRCGGAPEGDLSRSLRRDVEAAPPLLRAAATWLTASTEPDTKARRTLLHCAAEHLSEVQRPSCWAQSVLRATGEENQDLSVLRAAQRMSEVLGYPAPEPAPPSSFLPVVARPEHEHVYRVLPGWGSPSPLVHAAHALAENWLGVSYDNGVRLSRELTGGPPVRSAQVQADEPWSHAFPWELEFRHEQGVPVYRTLPRAAETADVRAVQAALNTHSVTKVVTDGVWGGLSQRALFAAAGALLGLGPLGVVDAALAAAVLMRNYRRRAREQSGPSAVVVACDPPSDNRTLAASAYASTRSVVGAYTAHGVPVREFRSPRSLPRLKQPPAVLHVSAPLRLRGGTTPCFDLSYGELSPRERLSRTVTGADLDPDGLIAWLRQFDPGTQPLVVLDPPRPGSAADIPLQLMLRNLFAASLFSSGHAPAVLGVGLLGGARSAQTSLVARAVRADAPLLRTYEELRGLARAADGLASWGEDHLEHLCVSLFASPAALRVYEPDPEPEPTSS